VISRFIVFTLFTLLVISISGCRTEQLPVAGINLTSVEQIDSWDINSNLHQDGEGNLARTVAGQTLPSATALELAAGPNGTMEYRREIAASSQTVAKCQAQFLSTQGEGRVKISALDEKGQVIGSVGWVATGPMLVSDNQAKWIDSHFRTNYEGEWLDFGGNVDELFAKELPWVLTLAKKYRLSVEVGQGQHVLIAASDFENIPRLGLVVTPETETVTANLGDTVIVNTTVENRGTQPIAASVLELVEPYGYGLAAEESCSKPIDLAPGEKRKLSWRLKAKRSDAVNLGKPWELTFNIDGSTVSASVKVHIVDNRPGEIYYVMTEDLEPIDSAGYPIAWGNGDGWLEPEELKVQMVDKVEAVDAIADKYGAKWTHYIAWPVVKAAAWADEKSTTGEWKNTITEIENSVRREAGRGHEYGIHMHSDYDPALPTNVLSYNMAVDGLWANHLRHGWAHIIEAEGESFSDYATRTGMLYNYLSILEDLTKFSPLGQLITARAGSFDFGDGQADELKSTQAYRKVGLLGGSDADGNIGGLCAGDFGKEVYLSGEDDINAPADDLKNSGIVEMRPTPLQFIEYNNQKAAVMNKKVDEGMAVFASNGKIVPGVHAIIGFTHMMFIMGQDDWKSTQGGQFSELENHLHYLHEKYINTGLLKFGTASDLVRAYLDYYTPQPVAVYGAMLDDNWGIAEYPITILGQDIPIDAAHPHKITIKYPLYLRDSAYRVSILKNGRSIYATSGLPTPFNDIDFVVDDANAKYSMKVYHNQYIYKILMFLKWK